MFKLTVTKPEDKMDTVMDLQLANKGYPFVKQSAESHSKCSEGIIWMEKVSVYTFHTYSVQSVLNVFFDFVSERQTGSKRVSYDVIIVESSFELPLPRLHSDPDYLIEG